MEEKQPLRILYKAPQKEPVIMEVENNLETLQELVGGFIECVQMPNIKGVDLYVNEEGLIHQLPGNFWLPEYEDCVKGACFMVAYNARSGKNYSITDKQIKECLKYIKEYELPENTNLYNDFYLLRDYMQKRYSKNLKNKWRCNFKKLIVYKFTLMDFLI